MYAGVVRRVAFQDSRIEARNIQGGGRPMGAKCAYGESIQSTLWINLRIIPLLGGKRRLQFYRLLRLLNRVRRRDGRSLDKGPRHEALTANDWSLGLLGTISQRLISSHGALRQAVACSISREYASSMEISPEFTDNRNYS